MVVLYQLSYIGTVLGRTKPMVRHLSKYFKPYLLDYPPIFLKESVLLLIVSNVWIKLTRAAIASTTK